MAKLCHICRNPEDQPGRSYCSSGAHPRETSLIIVPKPLVPRIEPSDAEYAIFFDIDGCCHKPGAAKFSRQGDLLPTSGPLFTWTAEFEEIIKPYSNVALVCHSMWRMLTTYGVIYHNLPPIMQERFLTCTEEVDRYKSIVKTASDFGFKQFIIIDDDVSEFPRGIANLVECDSSTGLSSGCALAHLKHLMFTLFGPPPAQ